MPIVAAAARASGATVRLLHVEPVPENRVNKEGHVVAYADQEMARLEAEGLDYLRMVETQFQGAGVECVVRFGDPVREILREADTFGGRADRRDDRGGSALGRVLLGSIAEHIIRKAEAPVILMRPARSSV